MCDCFHLAFPNWHAASSGTGAGRRLRAPEPGTEDDSTCDEPSQFTEGERPRPQGSSPVEEYPETEKYTDSDKECEAEHDPHHKSRSGKKTKKSGLGSMFEKRSTPKMSKLKEVPSPESGVIVKTAKDGCAEGLIYSGGGKEGIFIKEVVPESPASKSLKLKEGDQILSATVYFDNVSYEDAIQILEHAQAYKVKLCLKRKPDITETEPATESDVIPEDDVYAPEMREQGKTKRRGDARISWPKFPSFGKGRKSRFTRSHSSSEADEQRKLELSPTTSDTESPIKSQDALKGKKKHKIKLSALTKRGRISSSEDQDTGAPTSGQISGNILRTHEASDMLSPECLERPLGETPEVYVTEDLKVVEDLRLEQNDQKLTEPQTVQHKVELITIDSTLKTEDLTVALADQESPSGIKSPDGKKKKKERSELKMKILGKDKLHKKDGKAKSSPKRLKTLGASIEIADKPENEKSGVIPSFESDTKLQGDQLALDANTRIISSESSKVISAKSVTTQMEMSVPKVELNLKGEEKSKEGKDIKQKLETKTGPTFKLPKIGFSNIATEETIQKMNSNVEECTTKIEQLTTEGTEVKEDPYERLSKSSLSRTKLPKREDIEIPGMEDMSLRTTAKRIKEPKAVPMGHYEEIQSETVQLSIDVDSVKEAVSKLPGFKLPKVDTSGVPIPEEITVIDANAQRISVKTPTKVVDTKTKHEAHFTKFDITASPEISKTTVKLPKITPADLTSEELLIATEVDLKTSEKKYKTKAKQSDKEIKTEVYEREHIIIPGKESAQEAVILQAQETKKTQGTEGIKFEYESPATLSPKESDKKSKKAKITMPSFGIAKPDIKTPDIGIDLPKQNISEQKSDKVKGGRIIFLQEVKTSQIETWKGKEQIGGVISDVKIPEIDGIEYIDSVGGSPIKKDVGIRLTDFGVNLDAAKPKADISFPEIKGEIKDVEAEEHTIKLPIFGAITADNSVNVPDADKDINIDVAEIKTHGKGSKFKMPNLGISVPKVKGPKIDSSLSKEDVDVTLPDAKAEVKLPEVPEVDVTLGNVCIPEQKMELERPELEIKHLQSDREFDGQGSKFKMPKLGIAMPKVKGPEFDLSLSKKDFDVTLPEAKAEVKLPKAPEIDVTLGSIDAFIPEQTMDIKKPELEIKPLHTEVELDEQGRKFKMPKLGMSMQNVKGPEIHFGLSNKDGDVTLPEAKAEVKVPEVELKEPSAMVEIKAAEMKVAAKGREGSPSKFKMPTFKLPKFGIGTPNVSVEVPDMDKDVKIDGADINIPEEVSAVNIATPSSDIEGPSIDMKTTETEQDGKGSKFKMPHLGFSMSKVKGPKIDLSKKDVDVTSTEARAVVNLPEVDLGKIHVSSPDATLEVNKPELEMQSLLTEGELDGQGEKFKMSKFGIKMPKVKGPEIDLSFSKTEVDVPLPQTKVDVKFPDSTKIDGSLGKAEVLIPEAKAKVKKPELEIKPLQTDVELEGQGGKFKMPKFGITMPKVKGPDIELNFSNKEVEVTLPEAKTEVELPEAPKIAVDMKPPECEAELHGQGSRFKMPKFGIAMPKVKGPEIDLNFSKKDVDVTLPEAKAEVELPEAPKLAVDMKPPECEADIEEQGHKFKMPKFGITMPKVKGPEIDLNFSKKDVDVTLPETKAEIKLPEAPKLAVDTKPPECEADIDGQGRKLKMPKFGITMPKVKGPEFDLSLSKKDVDVTLPEAEAEVNLPDVELKEPTAKVEITAPEIEAQSSSVKGSPSKFKLPTFKFPKFGLATPNVSAEITDKDKEIKIGGADMHIKVPDTDVNVPEVKADVHFPEVKVKEPSGGVVMEQQPGKVEVKGGGVDMKPPECEAEVDRQGSKFKMPKSGMTMPKITGPEFDLNFSKKDIDLTLPEAKAACEAEMEGHGGKFKIPKFGITMPKVTGPEFDLSVSKKDVDVTLPEAHAEVQLPDVELKELSAEVKIKAPEIKVVTKDTEGSPSKFKMPTVKLPKFGVGIPSATVEVPDTDKDVKIDGVDVTIPEEVLAVDIAAPSIDTEGPSIDMKTTRTEQEGKGSKFKMPKFGITMPKVTGPEFDLNFSKKDIDLTLPEAKAEVELPEVPKIAVEMKPPECEADMDSHGGKFKIPKFGIKMPKVTGPEFDLSVSKKDVDVTIPETKAEVQLPDVELKEPSAEVKIKAPEMKVVTKGKEGSPSKFKMPTLKLPKFGVGTPSATVEVPDTDKDIKIDGADIKIPEEVLAVDIAAPSIDTEGPSIDMKSTGTGHEGKGSKFKMPSLGFSVPQVKHPDIDLSLSKKNVDVTLPKAKAKVQLPDVEEKESSAKVEIKAPGVDVQTSNVEGSPSKFKMPTFKLPKFGTATPKVSVEVPDVDKDIITHEGQLEVPKEGATVDVRAPSIDIEGLSVDVKAKGSELEGSGSKFKMPKFGISMPKVKGPEIDLSLSKKDVDVTLPEAKAEVQLPDVKIKQPSAKVEIKAPEIEAQTGHVEGSPSKLKMPTFTLPKFGAATPKVSVEVPDVDKDIKIDGAKLEVPKKGATVDVTAPSIATEGISVDVKAKGSELEGPGSKFKMPKFGISMPKVKGPEIDLSLSKKDVDVTLPEAKAEVKLPDVGVKEPEAAISVPDAPTLEVEAKLKRPNWTFPTFSFSRTSGKVPDVDVNLETPKVDITSPEAKEEVCLPDLKPPKGDVELEGKDSKFKMPKFGISMPKVKGPEIDMSLSKKDVDVTLPEAKAEVQLPDVKIKQSSAKVEMKAPEIEAQTGHVEGSPSKLKMPTFTLPKFGATTPKVSVEVPDVDKDIKIDGAKLESPKKGATVDVTAPSIDTEGISVDVKAKGSELEGSGSKFKMPWFGISMPKVKGPEIDLSLSKKDVDVTLPETKAEVQLPDVKIKQSPAKVEIKAPEIEAQTGHVEGSPLKLKMPTFTLPKFGAATPKVSVEVPDVDKDIKIDGAKLEVPKKGATVDVTAPSIATEGISVDVKAKGSELEGSGSKFKMPRFGISMPKVKGPEIDLSLSKKDVDVTLPETKAEVQLPDVKIKQSSAKVEIKAPEIEAQTGHVEGSPSKFKMPTFTLPKFGAATPKVSVEVPDVDKDIKIDGAKLEVPKKGATVDITAPSIATEGISVDVKAKGSELEGPGSKFKMPRFGISMPKVKGPEIDLSLSKKDVDVTLPETKAEVQLPDVKIKQSSAKAEIKAPEIEAQTGHVEGSPSKFKMPTFTLPKFGAATPKVSVEVPDVDKDIKIDGAKLEVPKKGATVDITAPSIATEGISVDVKAKGSELEGSGSKFKMPKFGISMPKVKGPEIDLSLSKKDVDVTLPEAKAEVQLPDVKIKQPSAKVEIKAPEIEAQTGHVEGSPSKFKMPTFTLPKFGTATPKVSVEVPDVDKDIKIDGAKLEVPKKGATVDVTAPSIATEGISVDVKAKGSELEGPGSKFKMPKFGISMPKVKGPDIDLSLSKKDVDVTLSEAKAEVKLPDVGVKEPEAAISVPDAPTLEVEAKLKRPNWTFPTFSFSRTSGKAPDVDVNLETPKVDITSPEAKEEVCLPDVEVQGPSGAIAMEEPPAAELDANLKKNTFSLPRFSFSKSSVKELQVSGKLPHVGVSLPEGDVTVKQPEMEIKAPELEAEHDGQESKFKLPKFGITLPKSKGPEDLNASQKDVDITLPEVKAEVKLPKPEVKESSASVEIKASETEAKSKDVGGSPLKFKMPTVKMPKFGGATYDVTVGAPDADKVAETDGAKIKEDVSVNIKALSVDIKTDVSKEAITDSETPKTETDSVGLGSPSKFKLPSFKMPKLSFSRPKPEEECVPVETECKEDQLEMEVEPKGESKSPKMTLTSFGEILKNVDVEFDVPKVEENLETSKKVHETDEPNGKQLETKEKETNTKQDTVKSPERTGWFKFPKFGLSSPSEPAKISEKDKHKDEGETVDEEISPTCSVQSSDAFADISSAMTSEHVGLSLSSPTKVTVKYSDPNAATGLGEMHSNVITSTTRTELISVEPNLPEKITILSSGVSSSSEDTLRLESGKIHVITSNIQATPEAQHAKLLTAVQVQSAAGLPLKSEGNEAASWTVKDSQSSKRTVFEKHLVRETSSESKETIVVTKQISHTFDSSVSGETASSIQRLRDSMHSEKMRFFDEAEK
ncbi:neuroblast differentiation-associated protein AHNAK [Enoplosus armatus]|uniref:neuroblast differentiation-associated protein AHNAK n=1 Tax=Enoplosus armatus TaxID=215367 RepID=UPI0039916383